MRQSRPNAPAGPAGWHEPPGPRLGRLAGQVPAAGGRCGRLTPWGGREAAAGRSPAAEPNAPSGTAGWAQTAGAGPRLGRELAALPGTGRRAGDRYRQRPDVSRPVAAGYGRSREPWLVPARASGHGLGRVPLIGPLGT
ncbi:hypothetical protein GCM10022245_40990 [Streptomyces mayteni]